MPKDYEQEARDFLAAAIEYRGWDEQRLEDELRRQADERGCDVEIAQLDERHDVWRVALTQFDSTGLDLGPITIWSAEDRGRRIAIEDVLLMMRHNPM